MFAKKCKPLTHGSVSHYVLLAGGADEAAGVVGLPQCGHHLPLNEVLAAEAASPIHSLVVQSTDVLPLTHEEASLGQLSSTYCRTFGMQRGRVEGCGKVRGNGKDRKKNGKKCERDETLEIHMLPCTFTFFS